MAAIRSTNGSAGNGGNGGFWGFANNVIGAAASVFGLWVGRDREQSEAKLQNYSAGLGLDAGLIKIAVLAVLALVIYKIIK